MKKLLPAILLLFLSPLARGQSSFQNPLQGPITATSAACAVAGDQSCVWQKLSATASVATVQVSGTFSATLTVEANNGGASFTTIGTITTAGTTSYVVAGFTDFRVRASAYTSGTAFTTINSSSAPSGGVTSGTADPTGNACAANALYVRTTNGALYTCNAGVFAIVSSGGTGTVTSVSFTGGIISIANPTTTPALTLAGTSGGIPYFSAASTWASSAALTLGGVVIGGGAGGAPTTNAGFAYSAGNVTCGIAGSAGCVITGAGATSGTATITFPPVGGTLTSAFVFSNNITVNGGSSTGIWGAQNSLFGNTITKYNNINTTSNGVPSIYGAADLTGQTAAKAATTLVTPTNGGMVRVTVYLKVTTAASVSSVLGGTTGVTITYTDNTDSVAQSVVVQMQTQAGVSAINNAGNATTTTLSGQLIINAKNAVAVQYAIDYTSSGTAMAYEAHLKSEAL